MKTFRLTLITTHQNRKEKAQGFAEMIQKTLHADIEFKISTYEKLTDSFKITCVGKLDSTSDVISQMIALSDRICSPWSVSYYRNNHTVELLFQNKGGQFRKKEFNVLHWAQMELE